MDEFIKVCAIAVISAVMILLLRGNSPTIAFVLGIAAVAIIIYMLADVAKNVTAFLLKATSVANISNEFMAPLIKTVIISVICRITGDICRDAGQNALAGGVDIAGAAAAFYIGLPILSSVLDLIIRLT